MFASVNVLLWKLVTICGEMSLFDRGAALSKSFSISYFEAHLQSHKESCISAASR